MTYTVVLTGEEMTAHDPSCPAVNFLRTMGVPVITLYHCERPLPAWTQRHQCFEEDT